VLHFGASPSGKAGAFEASIRWFESIRPSQSSSDRPFLGRPPPTEMARHRDRVFARCGVPVRLRQGPRLCARVRRLRRLLRALFTAWSERDAAAAATLFDADGTYQESGEPPVRGREAILAHFNAFFESGVTWEFHVERIIVEGPWAAVAYRFGMARPGGEYLERPGCALIEENGGAIRTWREYQ
jgi:limonene-1,2-epoxide hydrolase